MEELKDVKITQVKSGALKYDPILFLWWQRLPASDDDVVVPQADEVDARQRPVGQHQSHGHEDKKP